MMMPHVHWGSCAVKPCLLHCFTAVRRGEPFNACAGVLCGRLPGLEKFRQAQHVVNPFQQSLEDLTVWVDAIRPACSVLTLSGETRRPPSCLSSLLGGCGGG